MQTVVSAAQTGMPFPLVVPDEEAILGRTTTVCPPEQRGGITIGEIWLVAPCGRIQTGKQYRILEQLSEMSRPLRLGRRR